MNNPLAMMNEEEVMDLLKIKARSTLWGYKAHHKFPLPVRTRPNQYLQAQVEQWILNGGVNQSSGS